MTALYTDSGVELMFYRNQDILRRTTNLLQKPNGFFALLKTADNIISLTEAPFYGKKIDREIRFKDDAVTYIARTEEIETELSAHISRSAACEVKTIRLENRENQSKEAELLIYLEPALALQSDDAAHLAFSKLFIEIKKQAESNIVVARRKTRMGENSLYLAVGFAEDMAFEIESNRENVLRSPQGIFSLPEAFDANFSSKSSGVPDPCIALRVKFHLSQRGKAVFHFILSVGQTFLQAIDGVIGSRLSILSSEWNPAVTPLLQHTVVGRLADAVIPQLFFEGRLGTKTLEASEKNILPRNTLWKFGISGDFPIVLVELTGEEDKDRVLNYIELHQMLKQVGIISDLVFVYAKNSDKSDLVSQMYTDLSLRELGGNYRVGKDHLFYIDLTKELPEMICFFRAVASHIASLSLSAINIPPDEYLPITVHPVLPDNKIPEEAIKVINGAFYRHSFFAESGTKLPWSHILANDMFGTLLTNKSLGYTWAVNSRENKLTPWSNDTMADHSGEFLILKIDETYYNLCNGAQVEFSPGSAVYRGKVSNLSYELSVTVDTSDSRKRIELTFKNHSQSEIIAECAYYTEPIFSADGRYRRFLIGTQEGKRCILQNPFASIFESSLELSAKEDNCFFCFNSVDFFSGRWNKTKQTLPNSEPCAAIICPFEITGKGNKTISFTMEYKENGKLLKAETIKPSYKFQIKTPDKTLNALFNTWIPYQTEVCRMTARTGFYQCGGAYGFRDQLQDASAVLLWNPEKTRKHILRACIRQFEEGDVLHWWHELPKTAGGVKGVRTTCSDDLVWLPYTVCEYLDKTGDRTILNEKASFVSGESLQEGEQERYIAVETTEKTATVYEHCKLALERAYRIGEHGLPLIGNGDWNDGLNRIGEKGKGESVWLAEFLLLTLRRFSKVSAAEKDLSAEAVFSGKADALDQAISRCTWDGEWYLRAFTDDGDVLGSKNSLENTIDSLPQSFSVFARINPKEHCETALKSAWRYLVDEKAGIIKLFNEPFNGKMKNVGYIRSYPVGVRENGGQYTHAAVWLTMAMLLIGEHEKGYCMVQMLNPANHSLTSEQAQRYLTEPYYLDGDVYANPEHYARGGWSIYTGAAGWYFRCILETLLGFNFSANTITISPRVPKEWNRWSVDILYKNTKLYINAIRAEQNKILENGIEIKQIDCNGGIRRLDLYYK